MSLFHYQVNDGPERAIAVKTSVYVRAACVIAGSYASDPWPLRIKIWVPTLLPEYGPYDYVVDQNEAGAVVIAFDAAPVSAPAIMEGK